MRPPARADSRRTAAWTFRLEGPRPAAAFHLATTPMAPCLHQLGRGWSITLCRGSCRAWTRRIAMTTKRRGRRAWLAAVTVGLVGLGTLVAGWDEGSASATAGAGPADRQLAPAQPAPPSRHAPPPAVAVRGSPESNLAVARRHTHRGRGPDATGGQIQLPASGAGPAPADRDADAADHRAPGMFSPAWRSVLESRWQQRLAAVTTLSLAYHD